MAEPAESVYAIGRLSPDGPWAGLRRRASGWGLVFGEADGTVRDVPAPDPVTGRLRLLAAAAAYFAEALPDAPSHLEATQADLAELLGWLVAREAEPTAAARAREALDAIDDGLAGDAVVNLLNAYAGAVGRERREQADPIDLLLLAYRTLEAPG